MSQFLSVYVTVGSNQEAEAIARTIVQEKLAACATLIEKAKSLYRWKGAVEEASETVLFFKTTNDQYARLEKRIKEMHSYECPCIVAHKIVAGSKDYLDWLGEKS